MNYTIVPEAQLIVTLSHFHACKFGFDVCLPEKYIDIIKGMNKTDPYLGHFLHF